MELYQILCYYTDLPAVNLAFYSGFTGLPVKAGQKNLQEKVKYFNDWFLTSLLHYFGTQIPKGKQGHISKNYFEGRQCTIS